MKFKQSAIVVLVVAYGIGVGAQTRPSGPPRGVMVDIGGRRMHLLCAGAADASPTVVLLPGAGGFSSTWSRVQQSLPNERTCAYDPPGLGSSDAASVPRTLRQDAFDLNRVLERGDVRPPLILVGHSVGGPVARLYAAQFPGVAAMVLVDALHEDSTQFNTSVNRWVRIRELATGMTIPRPAVGTASATNPSDDLLSDELQQLHDMRLAKSATLGDLPLFVILPGSRERPPGITDSFWSALLMERETQGADLVRLSSRGVLIRAERSGHNVQTDDPELVARVVQMALKAVRDGSSR